MNNTPFNNPTIKLFGVPIGPFVRKVAVTLRLKKIPFDVIPTMPADASDTDFAAISPLLKVPALSDGDVGLADSSVICEYLEDRYATVPVYPADPVLKAQARWLEEYADTKLVSVCGQGLFFQRVIKPALLNTPSDEVLVAKNIADDMPPALDYLEQQVTSLIGERSRGAAEHNFLFGALSVADISIASHLLNAHYAGFDLDKQQWPQLAHYLKRVWQHSAFAEEIEKSKPVIDKLLSQAGLAT